MLNRRAFNLALSSLITGMPFVRERGEVVFVAGDTIVCRPGPIPRGEVMTIFLPDGNTFQLYQGETLVVEPGGKFRLQGRKTDP